MAINTDEDNVIYFTRLHWVVFFGPIFGLLWSMAIGYFIPELLFLSYFLSAFSVFWIFLTWVTYYFSSITIKKKQVILRTGLLVRQTVDIPFNKIETIDIRQSIIGSILNFGTLIITGTGGTKQLINFIHGPLTCRRYIEQMMNEQ